MDVVFDDWVKVIVLSLSLGLDLYSTTPWDYILMTAYHGRTC
jgi:hypothetical protein